MAPLSHETTLVHGSALLLVALVALLLLPASASNIHIIGHHVSEQEVALFVFRDNDRDGSFDFDSGELPLSGLTFGIEAFSADAEPVVQYAHSNATGQVSLEGIEPGVTYRIFRTGLPKVDDDFVWVFTLDPTVPLTPADMATAPASPFGSPFPAHFPSLPIKRATESTLRACFGDVDRCDDSNSCTIEQCINDQCVYTQLVCTSNVCFRSSCSSAGCTNTPISSCVGTNPCRLYFCDNSTGCYSLPKSCSD